MYSVTLTPMLWASLIHGSALLSPQPITGLLHCLFFSDFLQSAYDKCWCKLLCTYPGCFFLWNYWITRITVTITFGKLSIVISSNIFPAFCFLSLPPLFLISFLLSCFPSVSPIIPWLCVLKLPHGSQIPFFLLAFMFPISFEGSCKHIIKITDYFLDEFKLLDKGILNFSSSSLSLTFNFFLILCFDFILLCTAYLVFSITHSKLLCINMFLIPNSLTENCKLCVTLECDFDPTLQWYFYIQRYFL